MTSALPPEIKSLDFSQYHPLDHNLLACRDYPGGRRRHLAYRWDFQWRNRLRAWTLCRAGRHVPMQWWRQGKKHSVRCRACFTRLDDG